MHLFADRLQFLREGCQRSLFHISMISREDITSLICIVVVEEVGDDAGSLLTADCMQFLTHLKCLTLKVLHCGKPWTFTQGFTCFFLQVVHKRRITLVGYHGEFVDVVNCFAQPFCIHTVALLIDTDTQTTSHFLPLGSGRVGMTQRTNLKHVRIVPSLTERRV